MRINGTPENDNNLTGTAGNDTIAGLGGDDVLNGGLGDDVLNGGLGDDVLNGGEGDDVITFGAGQKTVNGGPGTDLLNLDFADETENLILTYNVFEGPSPTTGGILDGTTIQNIEQVNLASGSGNDLIDIATASVGSAIAGGAGDDTLIGGLGNDSLSGQPGNDTFFGGSGDDVITGGADNDAAVFLGLASNYEVVLGENLVTVTGAAPNTPPEEDTDEEATPTPAPESFTDTLSEVEIILFDNGEIIVETGEYIPFPDATEIEAVPTITEGNDADLAPVETPDEDTETPGEDTETPGEDTETPEVDNDGIPVYEFFRTDTQTQFYTTEEVERDTVLETLPQYDLEGVSFVGAAPPPEGEDITGISPVYRLFNVNTGIHLYTVDENERTFVEENLENYTLEGTPYYGYDTQVEGTVPLYRFYNAGLDAHFYTPSTEERDFFIESPDYQPEGGGDGIAFYVEPAPDL